MAYMASFPGWYPTKNFRTQWHFGILFRARNRENALGKPYKIAPKCSPFTGFLDTPKFAGNLQSSAHLLRSPWLSCHPHIAGLLDLLLDSTLGWTLTQVDKKPKDCWRKLTLSPWWYCWWKKSCTSWHGKDPIICRITYMSGGAGFLPSTVWLAILSYLVLELSHEHLNWCRILALAIKQLPWQLRSLDLQRWTFVQDPFSAEMREVAQWAAISRYELFVASSAV